MKKKKIIVICSALLIVLIIGGFTAWRLLAPGGAQAGGSAVYVQSVAEISGMGSLGLENRFAGVVEPQKEIKVNKDESKTISKLLVSVGDNVKAGDVLFEYDVDAMNLSLEQLKLELEGIDNKISTLQDQLAELNKQKNNAGSSEQLDYTLQIQSTELDIKTEQYNASQKSSEISKAESSIGSAQVKSEIDGVIKSINTDGTSTDSAYITILSTGNFRIKATATELSVNSLGVGETMTIRSRVDDSTWSGTISSIDREAATDNSQNNGYYMGGTTEGSTQATKYNFYIELSDFDGLMLGQHVYAEPGEVQEISGVMLPSYYVVTDDNGSFVWLDDNGKLKKQAVELGELNSDMDMYTVTNGLAAEDKIAFPEESLSEGMTTTEEFIMPEEGDIPEGEEPVEPMPEDGGAAEEMPEEGGAEEVIPEKEGTAEVDPEGGAEVDGETTIIGGADAAKGAVTIE